MAASGHCRFGGNLGVKLNIIVYSLLFLHIGFKDFIQFLYSLCATPQTVGAAATISCGAVNN